MHFHLSEILEALVRQEYDYATGFTTQLVKALHQVALESGSWQNALHFLPTEDPCGTEE